MRGGLPAGAWPSPPRPRVSYTAAATPRDARAAHKPSPLPPVSLPRVASPVHLHARPVVRAACGASPVRPRIIGSALRCPLSAAAAICSPLQPVWGGPMPVGRQSTRALGAAPRWTRAPPYPRWAASRLLNVIIPPLPTCEPRYAPYSTGRTLSISDVCKAHTASPRGAVAAMAPRWGRPSRRARACGLIRARE